MTERVVECVPNFSEGRDMAKMRQITEAIESVSGIKLMDVDAGADTNRTVVTFVGDPDSVVAAAFRGIAAAARVIDMRGHAGAHPRMGACDVCPFIPVEGVTMDDCAELARRLGERVGRELEVPVYLYEHAASRPARRNLAVVRKGEYEGLEKKLQDPEWKPDFGPARFNPGFGALITGAREFLIAYNITLNSADKAHATEIALELREKGRVARRGQLDHGHQDHRQQGRAADGQGGQVRPALVLEVGLDADRDRQNDRRDEVQDRRRAGSRVLVLGLGQECEQAGQEDAGGKCVAEAGPAEKERSSQPQPARRPDGAGQVPGAVEGFVPA